MSQYHKSIASHNKRETLRPDLTKITLSVPRFMCLRAIAFEARENGNRSRLNVLLKELATIEACDTVGVLTQQ
ncbi:MAG: hypothetical protein ACYSW3_25305 [Planctomycetota bacterium]|jgi:hypothetical protein